MRHKVSATLSSFPSIFVLLKYQDPFIEHGPVIKENTARVVAACQNHLLLLWRTILK